MKIDKKAYKELINQNLEWLCQQPRTLEREHIKDILIESINLEYPEEVKKNEK